MPHVLLIDDDDDVIQVNRLTLEARGWRVSAARSGKEGWDWLQRSPPPDAIVLDVMMESFNEGFTLAQDIRLKFPRVPMVMLTGVREHMSSAWSFTPEADGQWIPVQRFLDKPVPPERLVGALEEVMREASGASPAQV